MKSVLLLTTLFAVLAGAVAAAAKPNFIVISIDDLGYADIGPFGSKLNRTPHLDRMAKEGRKLTSFYAAPVCSPSRASLMTGCYAKRALPIPHVLFPEDAIGLSPQEITVAEVLKDAGYATAIIGKWHLGDQPEFLPNAQGFDLHFGLPYSNDMGPASDGIKSDLGKPLPVAKGKNKGQPPLPLLRNGAVVKRVLPDDQQSLVSIYTNEAVKFITEKKDTPFFLYLPHNAVHFPLYPGKNWAGQSPHGIYSDWVEEMDWSVGRVLDTLREHGLSERTLVIFTSDNGGTPRGTNAPLRGHKSTTLEGGMRVPTLAWWPGKIPAGTETGAITGMFDILPTFAALAEAKLPADCKLDGANIWPQLAGTPDAKPAHETFFYYRGLRLNAVRQGDWKLQITPAGNEEEKARDFTPQLFNLRTDIGEATNVAAANPEVVATIQATIDTMKNDLGTDGIAPGCRELGRVPNPKPLIPHDGGIDSVLRQAEGGDVAAQVDLAHRYRDGNGVAKDNAAALRWGHRAADAGNADAMDFIGSIYLRGAMVPRQPEIAFGYFKAAADQSPQAAFNLGQCYFGAQGTPQDIPAALDWWKKAAAAGHGRAAGCAAMAYLSGEGTAADPALARQLAERAAALGDPSGLVVLGEIQFQAGELDAAKSNWTKAASLRPTSPTGHPAQPSADASAQQGADLLKLIDYRQRKSEPGRFAFVQMPHIHQGYNNCGSTACATFARFQGHTLGGWDFKKLCPSPLGTGTDWGHLLDASKKIGQQWKLVTFTPDDSGFDQATAMLKSELDAGRPVVVDFKYIGPQYPNGSAGHTLSVCGYIAADNLYILCNPAVATPGLQLITAADLKDFWRSDHYGELSKGVLSRPAFVIVQP
jgi:arylsulfatase A-like enzyme